VPSDDPVLTGTFQVNPLLAVVGVPMLAPVAAVPDREKLLGCNAGGGGAENEVH